MMLFRSCLSLIVTAFFASNVRGTSEQVLLKDYSCQHPPYTIHLFSKAPLVIYISNFLTPSERSHLQEITFVASPLSLSTQPLTSSQKRRLQALRCSRRNRARRAPPNTNLAIHLRRQRPRCPVHRVARSTLPRLRCASFAPRAPPTRAIRKR